MENLSHSRLSKRTTCNGGGNTIYDDVFGGPPRFGGAPILSPRVEDYAEIFGGFHGLRSSSIPVLDLPLSNCDGEELFFDVRSSGFDYDDVFGGFGDCDFAVSFDQLMDKPNGRDYSSDEAWTPEEAGYLSEEFLNVGNLESVDGNMEFNISYSKASQRSNEGESNGAAHVTQFRDVPGCTFVVSKGSSLPKADDGEYLPIEVSNDGDFNVDLSAEMMMEKPLRKTVSQPANGFNGGSLFGNDGRSHRGYVRNGSFPNEMFVTISDVSLRTLPSLVPPPSRPPPGLDIEKRDSDKLTTKCRGVASEGDTGDSSPPYLDVEVDASSSAAVSAAAMKEVMQKAQAKLKSAKELMDRKKEGFHTRTKSGSKTDRKEKERNFAGIVDDSGVTRGERVQGISEERAPNGMGISDWEEQQNVTKATRLISDSLEGKKHLNGAKRLVEENHGRESLSSQVSDRIDGASEWKEATQFFELVTTNKSRKAFDQPHSSSTLRQGKNIIEHGKTENRTAMESTPQQLENEKKVKGARELEEYEKKSTLLEQAWECEENNGRSEAPMTEGRQPGLGLGKKVQGAQEACRWKENEKKLRMDRQPVQTEKKKTGPDDSQKDENMIEVPLEPKETMKQKEKGPPAKETNRIVEDEKRFTQEKEESDGKRRDVLKQQEKDKKLKETLKQVENERRVKEALEQEENEKRIKEAHEREENEKRQKEAYERQENEKMLREAHEREENERRLREVVENEKRLRETAEKEERERKVKAALEKEESERRLKEALEKEKHERRAKEEENEKRLKEAREKEENERRLKETLKQKEYEKREREALERKENEKRLKEDLDQEENKKKQEEACEQEETKQRQSGTFGRGKSETRNKETCEDKDTGKRIAAELGQDVDTKHLREAQDGKESEGGGKTYCQERVGNTLRETCTWENRRKKFQNVGESEEVRGLSKMEKDHSLLNHPCKLDDNKDLGATEVTGKLEGMTGKIATEENRKVQIGQRNDETEATGGKEDVFIDGKQEVSGITHHNIEYESNQCVKEDATNITCPDERVKKAAKAGHGIGQRNVEKKGGSIGMSFDSENQGKNFAQERIENNIKLAQIMLNQENKRDNFLSAGLVKETVDTGRKIEAAQSATSEVKGSTQVAAQQVNANQGFERKVKNFNEITVSSKEKEAESMKRERELEKERLRKTEEEREREREREKDRMAVDIATLEARERAYSEARERERSAMERAAAEARQRTMNEARDRLEKACAEARERSLGDKTTMEARLRAERAAVERATAEARERAFEKAMAERVAAFETRERVERSMSDKFSASSKNSGIRPSSSSSNLQDPQPQNAASFSGSRNTYSAVCNERYNGVEGESPQRCKARLERHRRTAERAAKALAEKNMRDHLAQKEQAERHRIAETLDAEVRRWSSGKEGNLRALLSTLQYILGPDSGWQPIPLTEVITSAAVKKAYRKATLCVHPDKLQQRGASIQQKYICEKVFDLLKEAWNRFNSEER